MSSTIFLLESFKNIPNYAHNLQRLMAINATLNHSAYALTYLKFTHFSSVFQNFSYVHEFMSIYLIAAVK